MGHDERCDRIRELEAELASMKRDRDAAAKERNEIEELAIHEKARADMAEKELRETEEALLEWHEVMGFAEPQEANARLAEAVRLMRSIVVGKGDLTWLDAIVKFLEVYDAGRN